MSIVTMTDSRLAKKRSVCMILKLTFKCNNTQQLHTLSVILFVNIHKV